MSLRYKLAIECDRNNFLKSGTTHFVPAPATWAEVRYYVLTNGGKRSAPINKHTGLCTTHLVAWHHRDWKHTNVRSMEADWIDDRDILQPTDTIILARIPCAAGYKLVEPQMSVERAFGILHNENDRINMVVDAAVTATNLDPADPRNHWCDAPTTVDEKKQAQPKQLHLPHGIPVSLLRPVRDGEIPVFAKNGQHYVLR